MRSGGQNLVKDALDSIYGDVKVRVEGKGVGGMEGREEGQDTS